MFAGSWNPFTSHLSDGNDVFMCWRVVQRRRRFAVSECCRVSEKRWLVRAGGIFIWQQLSFLTYKHVVTDHYFNFLRILFWDFEIVFGIHLGSSSSLSSKQTRRPEGERAERGEGEDGKDSAEGKVGDDMRAKGGVDIVFLKKWDIAPNWDVLFLYVS